MVLLTLVVAALVAGPAVPRLSVLVHALVGNTLVIVGAVALNQRFEKRTDTLMLRTARRPLPAGRLSPGQVTRFGLITTVAGVIYLACLVNWETVIAAVASWIIYVWIYTPLKLFSSWQTPIGAIAGAMPVILGAAAVGAPWSMISLVLFGILYFWQFPHAMAIAWLYRHDFAAAHLRVATVLDPTGRTAAILAVLGAIVLLPVSMLPTFCHRLGWGYGGWMLFFGLAYLATSIQFLLHTDDRAARRMLRLSFLYLPLVLAVTVWAVRGG
jgi:protoheme IX farnesyltransferase